MKEKKIEVIEGLKKSKTFPKNELTFKILYHLVEEEEAQRRVKSSTIAIDLFGAQDGFNGTNQDSYIRNRLFNIRKELNLYYLSEGKDDKYRLSIPKGEYKVKVVEQKPKAALSRKKKIILKKRMTLLLVFLLGLSCSSILLFFLSRHSFKQDNVKRSLVSSFFDKNDERAIIVGTRGFYYEYDTAMQRRRYIFDTDVELPTSSFKMNKLIAKYPEKKIISDIPFFHADIENMFLAMKLEKEWSSDGVEVEVTVAHDITKLKSDAVFISKLGSSELYDLSSYFSDSKIKHDKVDEDLGIPIGRINIIQLNDTIGHFLTETRWENGVPIGYVCHYLIKKVITTEGKSLLFLLAGSDGERKYINKLLFDETFQKEVLGSFEGGVPTEFELLIETFCTGRLCSSYKVVYNSTWDEAKQLRMF